MKQLEREPTIEELSDSLNISIKKVYETQEVINKSIFSSLNIQMPEDADEIIDMLENDTIDF